MSVYDKYKAVIGLECHIQLLTKTKMYSSDIAEYGAMPNTNVSVVTLGHPGTLPKVNKRAIEFAVKLGIATHSIIREQNQFARKNDFYADLPKGYQITQDKTPICTGGYLDIKLKDGAEKRINLTRIHMEEDAGKSMHDIDPFESLIDLNRAGTPLLEIVTEPDFATSDEAYAYLTEIKKLVKYLDICDGNMEEGSLRCDANISVMLKDAKEYGKKVEVKNMNSFRNVQRAIDFEIKRQIDLLEAGENIAGETRSFDAVNGSTFGLRSKENANDYRYFPEPDLQPVMVTADYIEKVKAEMPELPGDLLKKFISFHHLTPYTANVLIDDKKTALWYNKNTASTDKYISFANFVTGPIKGYLNENAVDIDKFPLYDRTDNIFKLISMIDNKTISHTGATQSVFPAMINHPDRDPMDLAKELDVIQNNDTDALQHMVNEVLLKYPEKVAEYKNGRVNLLGLFIGEVMKLGKGKADPKMANQLVKEALEK